MAYALRTRADAACPLRARSAGQYGELTVTPGQPNRLTHLRTGRLTRCANRPSKQRVNHPVAVSPRCPRTAINSQRSPPAATYEHEAGAGFEPASYARE